MKLKKIVSIALTGSVMALSAGAYAIPTVVGGDGKCSSAGIFNDASECAGGYSKNAINNSSSGVSTQVAALTSLGFDFGTGGSSSFDFNNFTVINANGSNVSGSSISVGQMMTGITIFGAHFGNGSPLGNETAFYKYDAGTVGTSTITFNNIKGISNLVVYSTGGTPTTPSVPEPATWTMLLTGFALMSVVMRRRQTAPIVS
ncbi:hypothetical conserved protein [Candidatus Nitrosoglobus terrae]|uniref:Hypothetical conserved protein n=1 Tax=Candidatus Nitrosoglobus terrae TaxID=1630141 RepID=A0A1Q2SMB7_9GAMM|nr:PEPxxWA-CTERM sorting domain-containing protein [Candidatus Nitrosoglobus terrae]BAW80262.1 hypothetical conserved protein [Candidatus Nitrosoglobus terrae]